MVGELAFGKLDWANLQWAKDPSPEFDHPLFAFFQFPYPLRKITGSRTYHLVWDKSILFL